MTDHDRDDLLMPNDPEHTVIVNPVVGICPIHGEVRHHLTITIENVVVGDYCFRCYADWIAAHIPRLEPLP